MRENMEISDINDKIKRKITTGNYPEEIKEFLIKMLILEFEHIDEARPRLNDEYEDQLKKYASSWKEE